MSDLWVNRATNLDPPPSALWIGEWKTWTAMDEAGNLTWLSHDFTFTFLCEVISDWPGRAAWTFLSAIFWTWPIHRPTWSWGWGANREILKWKQHAQVKQHQFFLEFNATWITTMFCMSHWTTDRTLNTRRIHHRILNVKTTITLTLSVISTG